MHACHPCQWLTCCLNRPLRPSGSAASTAYHHVLLLQRCAAALAGATASRGSPGTATSHPTLLTSTGMRHALPMVRCSRGKHDSSWLAMVVAAAHIGVDGACTRRARLNPASLRTPQPSQLTPCPTPATPPGSPHLLQKLATTLEHPTPMACATLVRMRAAAALQTEISTTVRSAHRLHHPVPSSPCQNRILCHLPPCRRRQAKHRQLWVEALGGSHGPGSGPALHALLAAVRRSAGGFYCWLLTLPSCDPSLAGVASDNGCPEVNLGKLPTCTAPTPYFKGSGAGAG